MPRKVLDDLERLKKEKQDEMELCKAQDDAYMGLQQDSLL